MNKNDQRQQIKGRITALSATDRDAASTQIAQRLAAMPELRQARMVALYAALRSEPRAHLIFDKLPGRWVFPAFDTEAGIFVLREVRAWEELIPGAFGVLEPDAKRCPLAEWESLEAILVPGMAFDRRGTRLGRGGGHYDRLLATLPTHAIRIGCFFATQEVPELEREPHDQPLDWVVTEKEMIRCGKRAS